MTGARRASVVLFDLDGTLLDTAPDMVATLNQVEAEESRQPLAFARARAFVSNGVLGLLKAAFGELPEPERTRLQQRFLEIYATKLADGTRVFPGMAEVLAELEAHRIPWGVVTNKPGFLTEPLLEQMELRARCACVVSGDTVPQRKPHPGQLFHALNMLQANAGSAIYVGDAERDIAAGRAAGMRTVAALYGYIPPGEDPSGWGADHHIEAPAELLGILGSYRAEFRRQ
jgi:N-acetyl-D-muramate 6-phosphate phosphatase